MIIASQQRNAFNIDTESFITRQAQEGMSHRVLHDSTGAGGNESQSPSLLNMQVQEGMSHRVLHYTTGAGGNESQSPSLLDRCRRE